MKLELLPAVDVAGGKAVRLTQGEAGSEEDFGHPLQAAQDWISQGAEWIHLVDLDAAFGRGENRAVIAEVVSNSGAVKIELSGGIRDDASLEAALALGASRVNLGTAALEDPEWTAGVIDRFGDKIAVGLDVRGTTLAARGWTKEGGELLDVLATCSERIGWLSKNLLGFAHSRGFERERLAEAGAAAELGKNEDGRARVECLHGSNAFRNCGGYSGS